MVSQNNLTITIKANSVAAEQSLNKIAERVDKVGDTLQKSGVRGFNLFSAAGTAAGNLISNAMSKVTDALDSAIKRVDTMNNFPKVMKNLGISTEDSSAAIQKMSKRLQGLPTALDDMAAGVQRIASTTGDVNSATDIMLAFNDAVLAGGMSADVQQSAIEQFSQAFSRGVPEMEEWRSMLTAMPAQLKQLATALGYANVDALGEDLRNGKLSMEDFSAALVKLDTEGGAGLASFQKQAQDATGGIQTGMSNMQTAITRGVSKVIEAIGAENISQYLADSGKAFEDALGKVAEFIDYLQSHEEQVRIFASAVAGLGAAFGVIQLSGPITQLQSFFDKMKESGSTLGAVKTGLKGVKDGFNAIVKHPIITIVAALAAGLAVFFTQTKTGQSILKKFGEIIGNVFDSIGPIIDQVSGAIGDFINGALATITPIVKQVGDTISNVFSQIGPILSEIAQQIGPVLVDVFNQLGQVFLSIAPAIGQLISSFGQIIQSLFPALMPLVQSIITLVVTLGKSFVQIASSIIKAVTPLIPMIIQIVTTVAQLAAQIAQALVPIIQAIINLIVQLVPIITPIISMIITAIANTISALMPIITVVMQIIAAILPPITSAITTIVQIIMTIVNVVMQVIATILPIIMNVVSVVTQIVASIITVVASIIVTITNIVMTIVTVITNAIAGVVTFVTNVVTTIINVIGTIIGAVSGVIGSVVQFFSDGFNGIVDFISGVITNIINFFSGMANTIGGIVDKIVGFFSGIGKTIGDFVSGAIKGVVNGALGLLESFLNGPINIINGAIDLINKLPGVSIGKISNIKLPRMAQGGVLESSSYVGDRVPFMGNAGEMVINRTQQNALWRAISSGNFGNTNNSANNTFNINIVVQNDGTDWTDEQSRTMAQSIIRQLRAQGLTDFMQATALR